MRDEGPPLKLCPAFYRFCRLSFFPWSHYPSEMARQDRFRRVGLSGVEREAGAVKRPPWDPASLVIHPRGYCGWSLPARFGRLATKRKKGGERVRERRVRPPLQSEKAQIFGRGQSTGVGMACVASARCSLPRGHVAVLYPFFGGGAPVRAVVCSGTVRLFASPVL